MCLDVDLHSLPDTLPAYPLWLHPSWHASGVCAHPSSLGERYQMDYPKQVIWEIEVLPECVHVLQKSVNIEWFLVQRLSPHVLVLCAHPTPGVCVCLLVCGHCDASGHSSAGVMLGHDFDIARHTGRFGWVEGSKRKGPGIVQGIAGSADMGPETAARASGLADHIAALHARHVHSDSHCSVSHSCSAAVVSVGAPSAAGHCPASPMLAHCSDCHTDVVLGAEAAGIADGTRCAPSFSQGGQARALSSPDQEMWLTCYRSDSNE